MAWLAGGHDYCSCCEIDGVYYMRCFRIKVHSCFHALFTLLSRIRAGLSRGFDALPLFPIR
jgi:hypothetical protein